MSTEDSIRKVTAAITELQRTTVPFVREAMNVLQRSSDQLNVVTRDLLQVVNTNLDGIAGAASRVAASGTELAARVVEGALPADRAGTITDADLSALGTVDVPRAPLSQPQSAVRARARTRTRRRAGGARKRTRG